MVLYSSVKLEPESNKNKTRLKIKPKINLKHNTYMYTRKLMLVGLVVIVL